MRTLIVAALFAGALALAMPGTADANRWVYQPGVSYYYTPNYVAPVITPGISYYYSPSGSYIANTPYYSTYPSYSTYYPTYSYYGYPSYSTYSVYPTYSYGYRPWGYGRWR